MSNDNEFNWYQIVAIIFLILYAIGAMFIIVENDMIDFSVIATYSIIGIISFLFIYGIGKIIQLLSSINTKLSNILYQEKRKSQTDNSKKEQDINKVEPKISPDAMQSETKDTKFFK